MNQGTVYLDNIIFSLQRTGGISIVWYELLKRLLSSPMADRIRFLEYPNAETNLFRRQLDLPTSQIIRQPLACCAVQRYLNPHVKAGGKFIFHSSYYRTCPSAKAINVTTVHDFIYEHFMHGVKKQLHCLQKHRAIRRADHIVCISEHTRRDLLHFLPDVDPARISVIHNGVSDDYHPLTGIPTADLPFAPGCYVLFVGSRASYKNFPHAVEAVGLSGLNLVVVGSPLSQKEETLVRTSLKDRYAYAGRVSNERLNQLYNHAYCLLYPSSYEGFGIPVLEAQKAGCPVIATRASSIPEIIGDSPLLLEELTVGEICNHLARLRDEALRQSVVDHGQENARRFTWDRMYGQLQQLYTRLLENG